jgi:hypothetical protein
MTENHYTTETRTKLASAIDRVIAMTDAEREELIDALLDVMGDPSPMMALFKRLQQDCESLAVDECVRELRTNQWDVFDNLSADERFEDRYKVSHSWTEKGLRYAVALSRLECEAYSEVD